MSPRRPRLWALPRPRLVALHAAVALVAAATACGSAQAEACGIEAREGLKVSAADSLPERFPSSFPLPADRGVLCSVSTDHDSLVFFESGHTYAELKEFFVRETAAAGWTVAYCEETDGAAEMLLSRDGAGAAVGFGDIRPQIVEVDVEFAFYVSVLAQLPALPEDAPKC